MKNLKKVLALVLVVATLMGLATVASAKMSYDYEDAASIKDERKEAVDVMSTLGVFQGTSNNFNPEGILTREEAAKIICYMVLTKEEADKLVANVAPYNDVSRDRWSAGPIGYCKSQGIIAGVGNGNYNPTGQLTGLQFAKMLLTALGYDASVEGLTGSQWGINTSKLAIAEAKIADGVTSAELEAPLSRQDACQLAFNTLEANMQEYLFKHSDYTTPHQSCLNNNGDYRNAHGDNVLQFCEKYFPKLTQRDTVDPFGRPSHEWRYDAQKIDNYVEWDKMIQEWTVKVTGKMVYDVVGETIIKDYTKYFPVDGETRKDYLGDAYFDADDLVSSNKDKIGETGKGVLTQVFQDNDTKELYVTVINTYLAKATEDYDTKNEDVNVNIYKVDNLGSSSAPIFVKTKDVKTSYTIKNEDWHVEEVKKDDLYLCRLADGEVQELWEPEILSEKVVVNFKKGDYVTSDGTQYDYASTVMYDEEVLDAYDDANMKDVTYNIILDPFGYLIGIERNEDPDQYVFLTGLDGSTSNIYAKSADANVIFMDGTMKTVKVNLDKSEFDDMTKPEDGAWQKNQSQLNTWCKYSVSNSDVYTLTEVKVAGQLPGSTNPTDGKKVKVAQFWQSVEEFADDKDSDKKSIDTKHVSLTAAGDGTRVYGNDATVYLNVSMKKMTVDDSKKGGDKRWIIDGVETVTTGIKDANITVEKLLLNSDYNDGTHELPGYEIYTLYDDKGYVKAAVTIGEDEGTSSNYVFVTSSDTKLEAYATDTDWTWSREVITKTGKTDITENGESREYLDPDTMERGYWYEVKYGADGHVRDVDSTNARISESEEKIINNDSEDGFIHDVADLEEAVNSDKSTVVLADRTTANSLTYKNGTLYLTKNANKGIYINPDVKTVLITADKKGNKYDSIEDSYEGRDGLEKAMRDMNVDYEDFDKETVEIHAIVEGSNGAVLIIINDFNKKPASGTSVGGGSKSEGPGIDEPGYKVEKPTIYLAYEYGKTGTANRRTLIREALESVDRTPLKYNLDDGTVMDSKGQYWYLIETEVAPIKVDGKIVCYATRAFDEEEHAPNTKVAFTVPQKITISTSKGTYYKTYVDGEATFVENTVPVSVDNAYAPKDDVVVTSGYVKVTPNGAEVDGMEKDGSDYFVKAGKAMNVTYSGAAVANTSGTIDLTVTDDDGKTVGDKLTASFKANNEGTFTAKFKVPGVSKNVTFTFNGQTSVYDLLPVSCKFKEDNLVKRAYFTASTIGSDDAELKVAVAGKCDADQTYTIECDGATVKTASDDDWSYASNVLTIKAGKSWNGFITLTVENATKDVQVTITQN